MNKKFYFACMAICLFGIMQVFAQETNQGLKYMRSSLSMVLIETEGSDISIDELFQNPNLTNIEAFKNGTIVKKEHVMDSWNNYPFPDKYNKHEIITKSAKVDDVVISEEELISLGFKIDTIRGVEDIAHIEELGLAKLKFLNEERTEAITLPLDFMIFGAKLEKFIVENKIANQIVKTWFNYNPTANTFDMSLIEQRGSYNASEMDVALAKGQARGMASIKDAGKNLISNLSRPSIALHKK